MVSILILVIFLQLWVVSIVIVVIFLVIRVVSVVLLELLLDEHLGLHPFINHMDAT